MEEIDKQLERWARMISEDIMECEARIKEMNKQLLDGPRLLEKALSWLKKRGIKHYKPQITIEHEGLDGFRWATVSIKLTKSHNSLGTTQKDFFTDGSVFEVCTWEQDRPVELDFTI